MARILAGAPTDDGVPAKKPGTALVVWEPRLNPEQTAAWLDFRRDFSSELEFEGYKPNAIAKMINQQAAKNPGIVLDLASPTKRDAYEFWFKFEVASRLLRQRATRELMKEEKFTKTDIAAWFRRNRRLEWGSEDLRRLKRQIQNELELTRGRYEDVLRKEAQLRMVRPGMVKGLQGAANIVRREIRLRAMGKRSSRSPDMRMKHEIADLRGDVSRYSRLKNIMRQKGPACAVHALHNILSSLMEERGIPPPSYAKFAAAVRRLFGRKIGLKRGLWPEESARAAELLGLKAVAVSPMPENAAEFEQLLASGQGAAYLVFRAHESEGRKDKSTSHVVFVGERWVARDGKNRVTKVYYSVADSNGAAGAIANYTWPEIKPMLLEMMLLKPADEAKFPVQVARFLLTKFSASAP